MPEMTGGDAYANSLRHIRTFGLHDCFGQHQIVSKQHIELISCFNQPTNSSAGVILGRAFLVVTMVVEIATYRNRRFLA